MCVPPAATVVQNKAVAEQGLEEGEEEEERRGVEQVEDMELGWMGACCTALDLHAAEPAVQVSRTSREPGLGVQNPPPPRLTVLCCVRRPPAGPSTACCCTERA